MTEPVLRLEPTRLAVEPGAQATLVVTVFNPGNRVEGYDLDVVAQTPMPWATVNPPTLSVYPQQEESAVVTFSPPAGPQTRGGSLPFGVRARSQVDAEASAVAEGDLDLGTVSGLQATLTPQASSGRWSGRHTVKVSNWGNAPARLRIEAQDPEQALGFLVSPQVLEVPLGGEAVARVKVRTRHPVLRGTEQRLPFQLVCEPEEPPDLGQARPVTSTPERPVVDGTFKQKPILTRLVVVAASTLLLLGIGGVAWALTNRGDPTSGEETLVNPAVPEGFRAEDNISPDHVVLVWEEVEDVDGYLLFSQLPGTTNDFPPETIAPATAVKAALPPDTEMCFTLRAVRGDLTSDPTEPQCSSTEPADVDEVEGDVVPEEEVTPPAEEIIEGGENGGENGNGGDAESDPLEFVTVMKATSLDATGEQSAEEFLASMSAAGVDGKLMRNSDHDLVTIGPSPTSGPGEPVDLLPQWWVYVDGATPEEAVEACTTAWAALASQGVEPTGPVCAVSYRVLDAPGTSTPDPTGTNGL